VTSIAQDIAGVGYALVPAATMRDSLAPFGTLSDWATFGESWDDLPQDTYMADGGRYRRRRHAVFATTAGEPRIVRAPHRAHYQTLDYNTLNGGVPRMFAPVHRQTTETASFQTRSLFDSLSPKTSWDIEMHQFRIESRCGEVGQPTPEGLHRDGVDYVLVLLIERTNIESGVTTIHGLDKSLLGSFTLATPLDAAIVCDRDVYHGVTAVRPIDATLPAHRDVLVLTFRSA
jgi:hypothetical protein